ncbi:hypothetical protein ABPG73_022718 [Tetrahymena malaccensis]
MDKQNILSQVQQGIDSTQNISTLNQLCQKDLDSNQKSNSKSSPSIMKEQEDKYFDTLNKENSQDVKQLSKEDIEEIQNKENSLSDEKELPKKTKSHQISQTTEEKQSENQILNQGNILNAKTDGEDQNIPISLDSDLTQKKKIKCSINRNQAKRPNDELSIEKKLTEKKQYSDKQEKEEKIFDSEIIKDKKSSNGLVIPDEQIQDKQQNKEWIFDGISKSDQPQPDAFNLQVDQIKTKQLEIEKQLTITYASQLEKIANQIKELKINGKDLDQQKFESINESQIQSNAFQDQKTKIFQKLNENNVQFIKILTSHDKQTLVLGIQKQLASELTDKNIKEIISFIYHNSTEQELVCLNQIFNTLQIKFDFIKIEQDNISIYNVQKKDFEALIYEKFKILTKFEQSVYQIKDYYYVIDSNNFPQNCQNCENYQCFQNTKARIIAFLQFKKHFYCEYQNKNKQTEELIFKLSKEEIITFYINFVYKLIFRFLENGEANEQNQLQNTKLGNKKHQKTKKKMDKQNILSQEQKEMNSTQNLSTLNQLSQKDLDSNQQSDQKSSPIIAKEQEKKNFDILNEENAQDLNQLSKEEDIEGVQIRENSQSDEKEFSKNNKSHRISQIIEEEESENQNLNQENLLDAKKQGEDQIPFHSDLTLKKKIQSSFNRNLAKSEFFQNGTLQVFNNKEVQDAIITYKNEENNICHQYQSTAFISKDISKQQIIQDQNSQTQTICKGKQNILEKKLQDKKQDIQQNNNKIFTNQIIEDQKNSNDSEISGNQNQDKQENKERIFKSMSKSDQPQPETSTLQENEKKTKQLEIEKQFTIKYASQIQEIVNQIEEFKINENELDQSKFENINESQIQSKAFQDQKAKIFQKLNEKNFQPRKILISHDKQTLVLCCQKQLDSELTDQNKKEIICFIYHNPSQSELVCMNQIFNTLLIKFDVIKIEQDNISILIVKKKDFQSLNQEKFKLLIKFDTHHSLSSVQKAFLLLLPKSNNG